MELQFTILMSTWLMRTRSRTGTDTAHTHQQSKYKHSIALRFGLIFGRLVVRARNACLPFKCETSDRRLINKVTDRSSEAIGSVGAVRALVFTRESKNAEKFLSIDSTVVMKTNYQIETQFYFYLTTLLGFFTVGQRRATKFKLRSIVERKSYLILSNSI